MNVQLFYGPPETTWILPTPDEAPPRRYIEREIREREIIEQPRRLYDPEPPRPVARYIEPPKAPVVDRDIRPIERLARVHTVPEPVAASAPHEEIRKVVEVPVPIPVEVPVPVEAPPRVVERIVHVPAPEPPRPVEVVKRSVAPPVQRPVIHHVSYRHL
jgi:hypothetical protein